jgi:hypothetical protein
MIMETKLKTQKKRGIDESFSSNYTFDAKRVCSATTIVVANRICSLEEVHEMKTLWPDADDFIDDAPLPETKPKIKRKRGPNIRVVPKASRLSTKKVSTRTKLSAKVVSTGTKLPTKAVSTRARQCGEMPLCPKVARQMALDFCAVLTDLKTGEEPTPAFTSVTSGVSVIECAFSDSTSCEDTASVDHDDFPDMFWDDYYSAAPAVIDGYFLRQVFEDA